MRRGDAGIRRMRGEQAVEEGVTHTARRLLDAAVRGFCRGGNVGRLAEERNAVRAAEIRAECRVARRFFAAQPVVEVRRGERIGKVAARCGREIQGKEAGRVRAARKGDDHAAADVERFECRRKFPINVHRNGVGRPYSSPSSMVRNLVYCPIQPTLTVPVPPWRFLATMISAVLAFCSAAPAASAVL